MAAEDYDEDGTLWCRLCNSYNVTQDMIPARDAGGGLVQMVPGRIRCHDCHGIRTITTGR